MGNNQKISIVFEKRIGYNKEKTGGKKNVRMEKM